MYWWTDLQTVVKVLSRVSVLELGKGQRPMRKSWQSNTFQAVALIGLAVNRARMTTLGRVAQIYQ